MSEIKAGESHSAVIGIGSNISPQENLPKSVQALASASEILAVSKVYRTSPVGGRGPDFLNAAVLLKTRLSVRDLREGVLREIESRLGRHRSADPNSPRTIDLDILIFDGVVVDENIWRLAYLCVPISDLPPVFLDPALNETLHQRATELRRLSSIETISLELHWS